MEPAANPRVRIAGRSIQVSCKAWNYRRRRPEQVTAEHGASIRISGRAGGRDVGYGCRLPLTDGEAGALFESRYKVACDAAERILSDVDPLHVSARAGVIVEMCYQLGERGARRFEKMLEAWKVGDYETAADEMLDSDVARAQPGRWGELAAIMRTGEAP